jgi:Pyruvate/2-oxoacid:ferredoxin oxidoreductase gamma subunit
MVLNIVMVGFFGAVSQTLDPDALRKAVAASVPEAYRDLNLKAFDRGFEYGAKALTETIVKQESLGCRSRVGKLTKSSTRG